MRVGVVFLLMTAAWAGCVDQEPAASQAQQSVAPTTYNANQGGGAIIGLVVDEELFPIEGAHAQIGPKADPTDSLSVSTDRTGFFEVQGLAPGTYLVLVTASGHLPLPAREVNVVEGETSKARFEMKRHVVFEARYESVQLRARWADPYACVMGPFFSLCSLWLSVPLNYSHEKKIDEAKSGPVEAIFAEATWVDSFPLLCRGSFGTVVYGPGIFEPGSNFLQNYWYTNASSRRNPTHLVIPRLMDHENDMHGPDRTVGESGKIKTSGKWQFYTYPFPQGTQGTTLDYHCLVDQTIDIWYSFFFGQPPPSLKWSALQKK